MMYLHKCGEKDAGSSARRSVTCTNKFFAFIDTSSDTNFGNIYVVEQSKVYTYAVKHASQQEYSLIPKAFIKENINVDFSVFADPEDKERLRLLTGLKYEETHLS